MISKKGKAPSFAKLALKKGKNFKPYEDCD